MIELTFKLTPGDGAARDILVRIHEPTSNPPEKKWPWSIDVEVEGRRTSTYGMDPLDAIRNASDHVAWILLPGEGESLDPPIEPPARHGVPPARSG